MSLKLKSGILLLTEKVQVAFLHDY